MSIYIVQVIYPPQLKHPSVYVILCGSSSNRSTVRDLALIVDEDGLKVVLPFANDEVDLSDSLVLSIHMEPCSISSQSSYSRGYTLLHRIHFCTL